jgi:hypothetical protein
MPVDLVLDLIQSVGHEDARIGVRRAHLRLRALQSREKLGVHESRFRVLELLSDVSRESEIGILVHRAGNKARYVRRVSEDMGERV